MGLDATRATRHAIANLLSILSFVGMLWLPSCGDSPTGVSPDIDVVRSIVESTDLDSLTLSVNSLSGEVPVSIDGHSYTISSRHMAFSGNNQAADYIASKLERYGLEVFDHQFSETGRNVYAVQTGTRYPTESYMICAHYDCYPVSDVAPGADDNASGTAAVLEAARLLSQYQTDFTVIYALWDEEEQGLRGSRAYAMQARETGKTIWGVINLDMIGWDSNGDAVVLVDTSGVTGSGVLYRKVVAINQEYQIGMSLIASGNVGRSDHVSFWEQGYSAIMLIEYFGKDFNLHYHTQADRVGNFNLPYFRNCARMAIGTLAALVMSN